ncbi:MAG: L-aspartate oxidase [Gemmatimonadetes bacterium]|nr:L-aspartate oxidase [Gemmatimonadota bacterium]
MGEYGAVVVGSGIAGLTYALRAAEQGQVLVITKKSRADSNTNWAQGGIAAVTDPDDTVGEHVADTLAAGAGLCRRRAVDLIVSEGPHAVEALVARGARFSAEDDGSFSLGREGGHGKRRIVHAADRTGWEIEGTLLDAVAASPRIEVWEHGFVLDLWVGEAPGGERRCHGVTVLDTRTGEVGAIKARRTMLATGGCGKVYLYTTNPDIATADGVAMAARAGCPVVNMEMVQFHPTCLYHPEARSFLISEAVRGEGAVLVTVDGDPVMDGRHPMGSLAPRDVVAREIDRVMKARGDAHVLLDVSEIGSGAFEARFPTISERLESFGFTPGVDPIPVVPAAHYLCGGVHVDLDGRTSLPGLFASGEVAHTGVHGANRLASNSLLEAYVIADRAAAVPLDDEDGPVPDLPAGPGDRAPGPDRGVILEHEWDAVRRLMWDFVGLVRSTERLRRAQDRLALMRTWSEELYRTSKPDTDLAELRNIALVGSLIAASALARRESRGLHQMLEYPDPVDPPSETWCSFDGDRAYVTLIPLVPEDL